MTQPPYDPNQPPPAPYPQQPYQQYPPPPPYVYQPPPPLKPVNSKIAFWTSPAGIISMLAIMGAVVLVLAGISNRVTGPASDNFKVAVTGCEATGTSTLSTAKVGLTVTNTSDTVRNATVKIEYRDSSGSRIDTDTAYLRSIGAGDTARTEETTILDAAPSGAITCAIVGIS